MQRILITEPIRTRADFFAALGRIHGCADCGPANLDDLADFIREHQIAVIIAANMEMDVADFAAIGQVLEGEGVKLAR